MLLSSARVDITPVDYPYMGGYGTATPRYATGAHSSLQARCVVFWDPSPRIVVTTDLLGIPRSINQAVRAQLPDGANLVLLASHTHNGPLLPESPDPFIITGVCDPSVDVYAAQLVDLLVQVVQSALVAPQVEVTLDYQTTTQSWSINRAGLTYKETVVPVLAARANGQPVAVLFGYGCHPVSAGNQTQWDGDYPSAAAAVIEAAIPGCVAVYIPGPAGDQNPTGSGWAARSSLGAQLGSAVVQKLTTTGRALGAVETSYTEVVLPLSITDTPANLASVRAMYVTRLTNPTTWVARHAAKMIDQIDNHTFATSVTVPIQVWKFSGSPMLRILFSGGEVVSGYAAYFRGQWGGTSGIWVAAYANEVPCYIPSKQFLQPLCATGSYEGGWGLDFPGIAGESMTIYPHLGHFPTTVEATYIAAVTAELT